MSSREEHQGDGKIVIEEHLSDGGVNRKAVGLFAKDSYGDGVFELSALSTASGAVLNTTPASVSAVGYQTVFVGTPTLYAVVNTGAVGNTNALATLLEGPNQIGSVTVANTVGISAPTLFAVVNTGAVGNTNALATLLAGPNQIGSVTVANQLDIRSLLSFPTINAVVNTDGTTVTANQGGSWDVRSVLSVASIYGQVGIAGTPNVNVTNLLSLASGQEIKSVATVTAGAAFPVTGTFFQATQPVSFGLVSLASGTEVRSLATILNFPATYAVTQSGTWDEVGINDSGNSITVDGSVGITGLISLASGTNVLTSFSGLISLASGTEVRALATVLNWPTTLVSLASGTEIRSLTTILPRTDYIGLVSVSGNVAVSNTVAVTQSGTWDEVGINDSGNSITVDGSVGVTGLISLASGTEVRSLATLLNQPPLVASSAYIGLASVNIGGGNVGITGLISLASGTEVRSLTTLLNQPALVASSAYIGLVSVSGTVAVSGYVAPNIGNVTLNASNAFIGLATTVNGAGNQYMGLVTNTLARGMTTSFATIYSGAGNYTLFQPPASQRWFVHNLMVNAMGVSEGTIKSGTALRWPWAGLATYGGFAKTFDNPGLPATAVNDAFVVTLNSGATVSVDVGVHFE